MLLRIETLTEKKLIGQQLKMSFANNKTTALWRHFMPRRKEIKNNIGSELYSIEIYSTQFFNSFNPEIEFVKWAAIEVTDFNHIPDEMETFILPTGLYAIFLHKGPASEGIKTYRYIFEKWLPNADFVLDNRPHVAIMGEKYNNTAPNSEEEIAIPVKHKTILS